MRRAIVIASAAALVHASPAPVPEPAVTAAALLPRADEQTLGWYSGATIGDQTVYSAWAYNASQTTYATSSTWFRRCAVGSTCVMYTGCSGGYMMAESTSTFCGVGGAATSSFCSNHILYTSLGAAQAYSWYWCDQPPLTGYTFYEKQPAQPSGLSVSSAPASSASTTSDSSSTASSTSRSGTASSTSPPAQSTTPASGGSSTNVGAIAGGVVGGVAGLALIGAAIFFLLRRNKNKNTPTGPPASGYAPPLQQSGMYQQPGYPASPNTQYATTYQTNEAKPQGVDTGYYGGGGQPAPYPQGPYDPHMSQYGAPVEAGAGMHSPTGPVPQELPTQK